MRTLPALFTGLVLLASFTRAGGKVALVGSESRIDFGVRREAALWYDSAAQQFVFDKDVRAPNLDALQAQVDEISIPVALSDLTDDLTPSLASVATSGSFNDLTNRPVIPTLSNSVTSTSASTGASSMAVKSANDLAATVQTELASLQAQLTSMRGFSKPDWIGAWRSAGTDTDITWTHNLKTEDLFYVIQLRFPNGEITQMNPMLTFPYHDLAKPQGRHLRSVL